MNNIAKWRVGLNSLELPHFNSYTEQNRETIDDDAVGASVNKARQVVSLFSYFNAL